MNANTAMKCLIWPTQLAISNVNGIIKGMIWIANSFLFEKPENETRPHFSGVSQVGGRARGGAVAPRPQHDPRSAVFLELRPNLVRLDAAGRRPHQNQVVGSLSRPDQSPGTPLQFMVRRHYELRVTLDGYFFLFQSTRKRERRFLAFLLPRAP